MVQHLSFVSWSGKASCARCGHRASRLRIACRAYPTAKVNEGRLKQAPYVESDPIYERKKLRLGEFQEFGFDVTAKLAKELTQDERIAFIDALITAVDEQGLLFGGGFNDGFEGFLVVDALRGSVTEAQRESFKKWAEARQELKDVVVGPLKDAWYST